MQSTADRSHASRAAAGHEKPGRPEPADDGAADERGALLAAERQLKVAALLARQEFATHADLLALTGSSLSTLRRDLQALERTGVLRRIRGGATRPEGAAGDSPSYIERLLVQALGLVRAGETGAAERLVARAARAFAQLPSAGSPRVHQVRAGRPAADARTSGSSPARGADPRSASATLP